MPRPQTRAPSDDAFAITATEATRLAYVRTGEEPVDELTHSGLQGLGLMLEARTAVEPAEPIAVDIERDDIVFFPLLYWAISAAQPDPSDEAIAKIGAFMRNGGTIFFDTRDAAGAHIQSRRRVGRNERTAQDPGSPRHPSARTRA